MDLTTKQHWTRPTEEKRSVVTMGQSVAEPVRAVFLDRDGVICANRGDHVKRWAEFEFLPEAEESLVLLSSLKLPIVVVTNQAIINRGIVSAAVVDDIHRRMVAEIEAAGGRIDRVLTCPHRPEEGCQCRKPEAGMLWEAAGELGIDLSRSYLIGDAATDILAGQRVGCHTLLVLTGRGTEQLVPAYQLTRGGFSVLPDLKAAAFQIVRTESNLQGDNSWWEQVLASESDRTLAF